MTNSILLIRHAQSANNALPESQRVPDPPLTGLGLLQAEHLARALTQFPITQLYCSPFRRSLDTTRPISQRLGLSPLIHADIYEQGGCYSGYEAGLMRGEAGMSRVELESEYPGWLVDELIGHEGWNAARDYESDAEVEERTRRVASWLTADWAPAAQAAPTAQTAAFVIHANFKRLLIGELLETDRWPSSDSAIWNTAITQLRYERGEWELVRWNAIEHLELSLRT